MDEREARLSPKMRPGGADVAGSEIFSNGLRLAPEAILESHVMTFVELIPGHSRDLPNVPR